MARQGHLGTMARWGRRLGSVEVVLDFGCVIYGLHGVWNLSGRMNWHLGLANGGGSTDWYTPSYGCYCV